MTTTSKLKTLPNIKDLTELRTQLYDQEFSKKTEKFVRETDKLDHPFISKLSQTISVKESIDLEYSQSQIQKFNLEGSISPATDLANSNLKLKLSSQKKHIIDSFAKMNNHKINEAEGVHLIYGKHRAPASQPELAPNFCSQLVSTLHFNQSSRMTLGKSHLKEKSTSLPFGQAILQISHLTHHELDLDLSTYITEDRQAVSQKVFLHEYCFSLPYNLNKQQYSPHAYLLYIKGQKLTAELIKKIIGFTHNGIGGLCFLSGQATGTILKNQSQTKKISQTIFEAIGNFIFDPALPATAKPQIYAEQIGQLTSLNGEILLLFYPLLQSFIAEYK